MKKILALVMILALSLSFASCGKKPVDDKENNPSSQVVSVETNQDTNVDDDTDTESQVETHSEAAQPEQDTASKEEEKKPAASKPSADKPTSSKEENKKPASSKPSADKTTSSKVEADKPTFSKIETTTSVPSPTISTNIFFNENNNTFDVNALTVKPRYVYWGKDGALYAECFVINGYSHNVFNINVKSITLSNKSGVIAEGTDFGVLNGVTLAPRTHVVWGFKFTGDAVKKYGADLSTLTCNARVSNNY